MRKSVIKKQHNNTQGFTLIEILVVMFIILILTGMTSLTVGHFTHRYQLKRFAEHLHYVLPLAEKYALLEPAVLRLSLRKKEIAFYRYCAACKKGERWALLEKPAYLKPIKVPSEAVLFLKLEDESNQEEVGDEPLLEISQALGIALFELYIGTEDDPDRYTLKVKANGEVLLNERK